MGTNNPAPLPEEVMGRALSLLDRILRCDSPGRMVEKEFAVQELRFRITTQARRLAVCENSMFAIGEGVSISHDFVEAHISDLTRRLAEVEARAIGGHVADVRALLRWHRQSKVDKVWGWRCDDFAGLLTDAFGGELVLGGDMYTIADIGLRMLQPRELYRAQGFPDSYIIGDDPAQGLSLTKADQVRMCGNSVCPDALAALIRANYTEDFVTAAERGARALPLLGVGL